MARGVQMTVGMRSYRLGLDRMTGEIIALGRDGRRYTIAELEHAEDGATRGDPVALEVIRQVELAAQPEAATAGGDRARDGPGR